MHRPPRPPTRSLLLGLALGLVGSGSVAQPYAVEAVGFGGIAGTSGGALYALSGALVALDGEPSKAGVYGVSGTLRTAIPASGVPFAPASTVINGSFEDGAVGFVPDDPGWLVVYPNAAGTNLLPYGDAEGIEPTDGSAGVPIPGWVMSGNLTVISWDAPGSDWLSSAAPGPADRGRNLFYGGIENPSTKATTRIVLPVGPVSIDRGEVTAEASGWFGGFLGQADTASLSLLFLGAGGEDLGSIAIGSVTALQRGNRTGLVFDAARRRVPPGAREVEAVLEMRRQAGLGWNDGMADNLSFVVRHETPGPIPGWSVTDAGIRWVGPANGRGWRSPYGNWFVDLAPGGETSGMGGVARTLSTIPNQGYRLRFALGTSPDSLPAAGPVRVDVFVDGTATPFSFRAEGTGNRWETFELPFTATSTTTRLAWVGRSGGGGSYLGLDDISVVPAASENAPVISLSPTSGGGIPAELELSFGSKAGQSYTLQSVDSLGSEAWTAVPGSEQRGTGGRLTFSLPRLPGVSARFFRVRVLP